MPLYLNQKNNFKEIHEKKIRFERDIQLLFERNLSEIMNGCIFVKSEFTIKNKRIDTLAYDEQTNSFVIIEYKRDKNSSVIDQGFAYLGLMIQYKADFIIEYNEQLKRNLKRENIDWSQSRIVFVSSSFTDNQIQATNFNDLPIELWEFKHYENDTVAIHQLMKTKSAESIKPLMQKNIELKKIADEIKVYTESTHTVAVSEEIVALYEKFRNSILILDDNIEIKPQKFYIAFKKEGNIACFEVQKKQIKIHIGVKIGFLNDARCLAKDVSKIGHYGTGDYEVIVNSDKDLEYIMSLIKQAL